MAKIKDDELCPCESGKIFKECHASMVREPVIPKITQEIKLKIIPEPDPNTRAIFKRVDEGTIIFSGVNASIAFVCGQCNSHLLVGLNREQVKNAVIKCNKCNKFNEV